MKNIFRSFPILKLWALFVISCSFAQAGTSPFGISVISPAQIPGGTDNVTGLRMSLLWGRHRSFSGLDLGVIGNSTDLNFSGMALSGVFNSNEGMARILFLQGAGIANFNRSKTSLFGFQIAGLVNSNQGESSHFGFQFAALANLSPFTKIRGGQIGAFNKAYEVTGLQIGLFNSAEILHGIQIGLLNTNASGPFTISPGINVGF